MASADEPQRLADEHVERVRALLAERGEERPAHWFEQMHYWVKRRCEWLANDCVCHSPEMPKRPMSEPEWNAFKAQQTH